MSVISSDVLRSIISEMYTELNKEEFIAIIEDLIFNCKGKYEISTLKEGYSFELERLSETLTLMDAADLRAIPVVSKVDGTYMYDIKDLMEYLEELERVFVQYLSSYGFGRLTCIRNFKNKIEAYIE